MKNAKNLIIFVFSLIIIVQSAIIIHLISARKPAVSIKQSTQVTRRAVSGERRSASYYESRQLKKEAPGAEPRQTQGMIALVIDDWGYNLRNKDFITGNDFHVTLSILPFRAYSTRISQMAHKAKKEQIIHMPLEPKEKEKYGLEENTILVGMDRGKIIGLLDAATKSVPYASGISNHMGSRATEDSRTMTIVLEYIKEKKMFFLDSVVTPDSVCEDLSNQIGVVFFQRDFFIDNESDPVYIKKQLLNVANRASRKGFAVGIGHDRPVTISVLKEVIPELQKEGYQFVYLSELAQVRGQRVEREA